MENLEVSGISHFPGLEKSSSWRNPVIIDLCNVNVIVFAFVFVLLIIVKKKKNHPKICYGKKGKIKSIVLNVTSKLIYSILSNKTNGI